MPFFAVAYKILSNRANNTVSAIVSCPCFADFKDQIRKYDRTREGLAQICSLRQKFGRHQTSSVVATPFYVALIKGGLLDRGDYNREGVRVRDWLVGKGEQVFHAQPLSQC